MYRVFLHLPYFFDWIARVTGSHHSQRPGSLVPWTKLGRFRLCSLSTSTVQTCYWLVSPLILILSSPEIHQLSLNTLSSHLSRGAPTVHFQSVDTLPPLPTSPTNLPTYLPYRPSPCPPVSSYVHMSYTSPVSLFFSVRHHLNTSLCLSCPIDSDYFYVVLISNSILH
ncbi:hypothetical protein F5B22DRAFT_607192 [Xylaria bambusicola]|uniref:uncharacterized protein n=1 Tax=Xylaria bambusicola TaxID=326684 RepID=UPI0020078A4C|nr:uncharacterized protein F5B22DRAFT_607192 [Xylaria bambusicola]KAI0515395.1 hypothetical protein F5B22DRAFT_607192 [Xylaria bambusicola]